MREFFDIGHWLQWLEQLDRTFAFLLALPFVVAIVGLWAAYRERDRDEMRSPSAAGGRETGEGAANSPNRDLRRFDGKPHGHLTD